MDQYLLENSDDVPVLRVTNLKFAIEYRSTTFRFYFNIIKLSFVITSVAVYWKYSKTLKMFERDDVGIV